MLGPTVAFVMLTLVLVTAAVSDWRTHKVPNWLTFPAIGLGLAWAAVWGATDPRPEVTAGSMLVQSLIGFGTALIAYSIMVAMGGLHPGDVKTMAAIGAISASWKVVFAASIYAFLAAGLLAVVLMIRHGIVKRTMKRLAVAAVMTASKVKPPEFDTDTPRIPFAAAACVGGLLAFAEIILGLHTPWGGYGFGA